MRRHGIGRLPVVAAGGTLVGIVTPGDLLRVRLRRSTAAKASRRVPSR
jgi:CBS domain-containing protein